MLESVLKSYKDLAEKVDWKKYDQNELFFNYLEHKDDSLGECFYAAIICRYWGYTGRLYLKAQRNITFEECYDVLIDTINYLLEKQVWNNPESSLYKDPKGPEKAFHLVLKRQLGVLLARKSTQKEKANFKSLSIDDIHEKYNDSAEGLFNLITDNNSHSIYDYILSMNTLLEKVILDMICFSNWRSLGGIAVKIKTLNNENFSYYYENYFCTLEEYEKMLDDISGMSLKQLTTDIKKCLYSIRKDWE